MDYSEQLKDYRWIAKRNEIIERDLHICQKCMSTRNLNVHHKLYIRGRMAWEYSNTYLITLCEKCHAWEHANRVIKVTDNGDPLTEAFENLSINIGCLVKVCKKINEHA